MMGVDFYVLALWFAYSLAFAISVSFLYYAYRKSLQQMKRVPVVQTPYFINVIDDKAYAMIELAEELAERAPKKAVELSMEALERLLEKACMALNIDPVGGLEDKVKRLEGAGLVLPPEFGRIRLSKRPKEVVALVKFTAGFLREAPIMVKKSESPSI